MQHFTHIHISCGIVPYCMTVGTLGNRWGLLFTWPSVHWTRLDRTRVDTNSNHIPENFIILSRLFISLLSSEELPDLIRRLCGSHCNVKKSLKTMEREKSGIWFQSYATDLVPIPPFLTNVQILIRKGQWCKRCGACMSRMLLEQCMAGNTVSYLIFVILLHPHILL